MGVAEMGYPPTWQFKYTFRTKMKIIHEHQIWGFRGLPNFGQTHDASDIPSER
jgi:hypothetical protein